MAQNMHEILSSIISIDTKMIEKLQTTDVALTGIIDKLSGIQDGAQVNKIQTIQLNGVGIQIFDKTVNLSGITLKGNDFNIPCGLVQLDPSGKIPSGLFDIDYSKVITCHQDVTSANISNNKIIISNFAVPAMIKTSKGNLLPIERQTMVQSGSNYQINVIPYLAYDQSAFLSGVWRIYFIAGLNSVYEGHAINGPQGLMQLDQYGKVPADLINTTSLCLTQDVTNSDLIDSKLIQLSKKAMPISIKTSAGNIYPIEKLTLTQVGSYYYLNIENYLVYDNVAAMSGTWTVYFGSGVAKTNNTVYDGTILQNVYVANYKNGDIHRITLTSGITVVVTNLPIGESLLIRVDNSAGTTVQYNSNVVIDSAGNYLLSFMNITGTVQMLGSAIKL